MLLPNLFWYTAAEIFRIQLKRIAHDPAEMDVDQLAGTYLPHTRQAAALLVWGSITQACLQHTSCSSVLLFSTGPVQPFMPPVWIVSAPDNTHTLCTRACVPGTAELTEGFSGAEVASVCREAALNAMREDVNAEKVHFRHFLQVRAEWRKGTVLFVVFLFATFRSWIGDSANLFSAKAIAFLAACARFY